MDQLVNFLGLPANVLYVLGGIFVALVLGTIARITHLHKLPPEQGHSLLLRLRTWWIIAIVLTLVVLLKRPAIVLFLGLISFLALRELYRLIPDHPDHGKVIFWAYLAVPCQFLWIYQGYYVLFLTFIPVVVFLVITTRAVLLSEPDVFLPVVGTLHWGTMIVVFCFSHVAYLMALPEASNPAGGGVGWFLYLVILTEFNDICQALWGRPFGKHKIIPAISPGKSWEGFLGGVIFTIVAAVLLAPLLTPLGTTPPRLYADSASYGFFSPWAALAGLFIGVAGFFGDISMSALKRHCHVKDSGSLLPGQGGILDRIDSLTFTAPLFFHYVHFLYP